MIDPLTEDEHKALLANSEELQLRRAEDEKQDIVIIDCLNGLTSMRWWALGPRDMKELAATIIRLEELQA